MHHTSQLQAVLEILEECLDQNNKKPADDIFVNYCRKRRYIGSKDRQIIASYFYSVLRFYEGLEKTLSHDFSITNALLLLWLLKNKSFESLFTKHEYGIQLPSKNTLLFIEKKLPSLKENLYTVPEWTIQYFQDLGPLYKKHIQSLFQEAEFDIRINPLLCNREDVLKQFRNEEIEAISSKLSPFSIKLKKRVALQGLDMWKNGLIEIQDEGAQIVSILCDPQPQDTVLDYCAGAGGKTLLLSALMQNKGRVIATDLYPWRLDAAKKRLKRAQAFNVQIKNLAEKKWWKRHEEMFDRVLIDVPCSGSGTWRRNPDLKRRFQETDLQNILQTQKEILVSAARYVKPGGFLIYATCSLWKIENHDQIESFLKNNPMFSLENVHDQCQKHHIFLNNHHHADADEINYKTLQLTPYEHHVDGFFTAILKKEEKR